MKRFLPILLFASGCGIKANPQVLKDPEVEIKRLGEEVYVKSLSGEIRVRGFERQGDYWVKKEKEPFCFVVERLGEASRKLCVNRALEEKPSLRFLEGVDHIELVPSGFDVYRVYSIGEDGSLVLDSFKTFKQAITLQRDYWERCYALTGVRDGEESSPVSFCIKPKPPPPIPEVDGLEIRVGKDNLYLVWFYEDNYREFVIYKNGKIIGRTTGYAFETEIPKEKATFTVRVVSPLGFESKGVSVYYSP